MTNPIIHIANDEKFINSANWQFENAFPNKNKFYIYFQNKNNNFIHVENKENVTKFSIDEDLDTFITSLQPNQIIVFHSLSDYFFSIVLRLPSFVKCIWFCFGYEVYNDKNLYNEYKLLDKITKQNFGVGDNSLKKQLKNKIRPFYRKFNKDVSYTHFETKMEVFKRMDYIACSFDEEYNSIKKIIKQEKKTFPFWYYPIEKIINIDDKVQENRNDIIIGNSGFMSGNHLDVFDIIKNSNFNDRKIIVPLSYGNKDYIDVIIEKGKLMLGNNFQPLTTFLPLQEYNKSIKNCSHAIFSNHRQQAVGNTIALLWFGSKVFLSNKNPFYGYLKRIGVNVYSVQKDLLNKNAFDNLTAQQIETNRAILFKNLNTQLLLENIKNGVYAIQNKV